MYTKCKQCSKIFKSKCRVKSKNLKVKNMALSILNSNLLNHDELNLKYLVKREQNNE